MNDFKKRLPRIENSADNIKRLLIKWLINGGMGFNIETDAIGNEVLFSRAKRRADILIFSQRFHALEVKGELDTLDKLFDQLEDYQKTFDKVSVVTTDKHYAKVLNMASQNTGIILVEGANIHIARRALINRDLDKLSLFSFLDKTSLKKLLLKKGKEKYTDELQFLVSQQKGLKTEAIRQIVYQKLKEKYTIIFQRFLRDIGEYPVQIDDLRSLNTEVSASIVHKGGDDVT
jgi:hypothetical protein